MSWRDLLAAIAGRYPPADPLADWRYAVIDQLRRTVEDLEREKADLAKRLEEETDEHGDELRHLVRLCWAAWNDATIDDDDRQHSLDLTPEQQRLLHEAIEWSMTHQDVGAVPPFDHEGAEPPPVP